MHEGIAADGSRLFPVFPYPSYTKVSDEDVNAIYAYLRTLKAVSYVPPRNGKLLRQRWALPIWNSLFFTEGRFRTNAKQSAEWNRGAYLVQGLGHCGACHTPRNWFMAEDVDGALQGGLLMDRVAPGRIRLWSAVDLTSSKTGLAAWSVDELTKYLHTGFSRRAGTFGPMNEVIVNSLRKLTADDVHAMAVYLKALPSAKDYADASPSPAQVEQGQALYDDHCEECHSASGRGGMFSGPPLAGSAVVQAENPASLINIILHGPETPKEISFGSWETMKAYRDVLNDSEVAAVSNYVRGSWGNRGNVVDASQVEQQR